MIIADNINTFSYKTNSQDKKVSNNNFEYELTNSKEKETNKDITQRLLDDIRLVMSTGLTQSELEELEQLVKDIQKRIKEESSNRSDSIKDIEEMLKKLEYTIAKLQKRSSGIAIKNPDSNKTSTQNLEGLPPLIVSFIQRVESAKVSISELKDIIGMTNNDSYDNSDNDTLKSEKFYTQDKLEVMQKLKSS